MSISSRPDVIRFLAPHALEPADIAESVHWAASQPAHVNVNTIELMPVAQSFAPFQVHRDSV
jgi:hypothetical protein